MTFLVDFPWYDSPALARSHDRLWTELKKRLERRGLANLPDLRQADRKSDRLLESDRLLISQTCGYDVATQIPRRLRLIGAPVFDLPDCPRGHYFSYVVMRRSGGGGRRLRLAINDVRSWSGCHALLEHCRRQNLDVHWTAVSLSGGHATSLERLLQNKSDMAAIDAVSWTLLTRHRPALLDGLRVVAQTPPIPAPPYVTSPIHSAAFAELLMTEMRALTKGAPWIRKRLLLLDIQEMTSEDYERCQRENLSEPPETVAVLKDLRSHQPSASLQRQAR